MKKIRIGTLACILFGHKFHGERIEFNPHYLKMVEQGMIGTMQCGDYHLVGFQTDYCVRCGIKRNLIK